MNKEKYVDESWKEQAGKEKDTLSVPPSELQAEENKAGVQPSTGGSGPSGSQPGSNNHDPDQDQGIEVNFMNYVTSMGFQAMIFMGEIPNPVTNTVDKNLVQAKFLIDTLCMLKEKTEGNLTDQELNLLENSTYELQLRYVQLVQKEQAP